MAKKEKSYNPAQEQHKKDKKRALDKQKRDRQNAQLQHLSHRNPATLESQIQNLKQMDSQGRLPDADRAVLATLEKELRLVKKAKALAVDRPSGPVIVSDKTKGLEAERVKQKEKEQKRAFKEVLKNKRDPKRSVYYDEVWNPYGVPPEGLPWKERDEDDSEGWSTDEDVRRIPMPRDTPPATEKPKSQPQQAKQPIRREPTPPRQQPKPKTVEKVPEPEVRKDGPSATIEEAFLRAGATVIEAAPVLRDFQKEAVSIVPTIVKRRPPKKSTKVENTAEPKHEPKEKSFATTVEDGEDEEIPAVQGVQRMQEVQKERETPIVPVDSPLKRPLEEEKKLEAQPPPAAPPKRRRIVNAAPDV